MNIWFINQYAIPPSQAGITRHYDFAKALIQRNHTVTVIASSFDHVTRQETRLQPGENLRLEENSEVPFLWLRTPPYAGNGLARIKNMLRFSWSLFAGATQGLPKPDVIVGSSPHLFAALSGLLLAKRYGVPFVLEVRDLWPQSLMDLAGYSTHHPLVIGLELIERQLYRQASQIVTLLPQASTHIQSKGAKPEKITWIPNGISLSRIPDQPVQTHSGPFTVMYAGSHGLINSLKTVLDAAQLLQQRSLAIHIRLVGDGPDKSALKAYAHELGLRNVSFEDPLPKSQIYGRLLEADAFVLNMKNKALYKSGISVNKLYDFMGCGRPVVFGADVSNNPLQASQAGLTVGPDNAEALALAMQTIAALPIQTRLQMGAAGRAYALQHHDLGNLALIYEQLLCKAFSSPSNRSTEPERSRV